MTWSKALKKHWLPASTNYVDLKFTFRLLYSTSRCKYYERFVNATSSRRYSTRNKIHQRSRRVSQLTIGPPLARRDTWKSTLYESAFASYVQDSALIQLLGSPITRRSSTLFGLRFLIQTSDCGQKHTAIVSYVPLNLSAKTAQTRDLLCKQLWKKFSYSAICSPSSFKQWHFASLRDPVHYHMHAAYLDCRVQHCSPHQSLED